MLIRFSVQNWMSFRDQATLALVASRERQHGDRIAREGTRFSACITPNLVCQPSRASILTGLLPLTHGVWDNGVDLDPQVGEQGFAGTLPRAGYQTGFIGKAHFSTKATFAPTGTPEPASLLLVGVGVLGLGAARRWRGV